MNRYELNIPIAPVSMTLDFQRNGVKSFEVSRS